MMRDFFNALRRNAPASQHVFEKRPHVLRSLRTPERNDENGIKQR
jgi:hypothetical protein